MHAAEADSWVSLPKTQCTRASTVIINNAGLWGTPMSWMNRTRFVRDGEESGDPDPALTARCESD